VLLRGSPQGATGSTGYLQADLREPELILDRAAGVLDSRRRVRVIPAASGRTTHSSVEVAICAPWRPAARSAPSRSDRREISAISP
jgi:hypothetical protein